MGALEAQVLVRQHLIDPEICIRCNTCEDTCPIDAITHDDRNYVVDPSICNGCQACVSPCPTGSIDHWHQVPAASTYSVAEQLTWDELPPQQNVDNTNSVDSPEPPVVIAPSSSHHAPWSAAHAYVQLYDLKKPVMATVVANVRLTGGKGDSDVRHIVLSFGEQFFPVLEGQSIGILPPGMDVSGKPHYLRMYSVASPRDGEQMGHNSVALTVKRVVADPEGGKPVGVASNYLCDLKEGDSVRVTGPFGERYLMPNHPGSQLMMICTGTGIAPMRAMIQYRRRLAEAGHRVDGKMMLFYGARTSDEMPYRDSWSDWPADQMQTHLAFSRAEGQAKIYVQDKLREAGSAVAELLKGDTWIYICGLKGMEEGVLAALADVSTAAGLDWASLHPKMLSEGRFHIETY